jgi:NitT/TauT family transport system substrate-binding protein
MDAAVKGLPIVVIGAMARSNDNAWYVKPDSPIKSVKDVVGKKVAYTSPKSISEAFARMIFERAGLDQSKITLVAAGGYPQGLTMLDTGSVDIAAMAEPLKTRRKAKYREVFNAEDNLPLMTAVLAVTTRDYAAKSADLLRKILAARRKSVEYVYAHPHEAGMIMAKAYNMSPEESVACIENVVKMKQKLWLYGDIDIDELTPMQKGLAMTGVKLDKMDWKHLIDISYLPDDLKAKSKLPR